jgi:hypothetical protein
MPVINSVPTHDLDLLVAMHGTQDPVWLIEGIAIDLNITVEEAQELLVKKGYLTVPGSHP